MLDKVSRCYMGGRRWVIYRTKRGPISQEAPTGTGTVLFKIAKTWKQPKYSSVEECMNKPWMVNIISHGH